jgi:NAD(P)-dependent dehydrogenase (short-subunit alcohol dehydrogenase family)
LEYRNATAAVIGAGDFIGGAIAKKFAAEGFTVFAGRRNGDKLAPLVAEVETAGGHIVGRSLDARKEEEMAAFLRDADAAAPLEVCIFNGDGLLRRLLGRSRGCAADAAARPG